MPLLSKTHLDRLPPRIVRFCLVPGKTLYTADTLSCAPVDSADKTALVDAETKMFIQAVISQLPAAWMIFVKLNMMTLLVPN